MFLLLLAVLNERNARRSRWLNASWDVEPDTRELSTAVASARLESEAVIESCSCFTGRAAELCASLERLCTDGV